MSLDEQTTRGSGITGAALLRFTRVLGEFTRSMPLMKGFPRRAR
jgi:hypothetical protein